MSAAIVLALARCAIANNPTAAVIQQVRRLIAASEGVQKKRLQDLMDWHDSGRPAPTETVILAAPSQPAELPQPFPANASSAAGWTIDPTFLERVQQQDERNEYMPSLEGIEAVLLALTKVQPAEPVAQAAQQPVGEVILFGGDCKEISWSKGKMPPPGTKLYVHPAAEQAAADEMQVNTLLELIEQYGDERATKAYHGELHCRQSPESLMEKIRSEVAASRPVRELTDATILEFGSKVVQLAQRYADNEIHSYQLAGEVEKTARALLSKATGEGK